jgi:hypothetical protein
MWNSDPRGAGFLNFTGFLFLKKKCEMTKMPLKYKGTDSSLVYFN